MEIQPLDGIDEHPSGETPEDVAILYSWANLEGAKYRDFSANRREYRAQMRHRAAEQLRLMELRAQSEAEAAAVEAEAEAAAAHAEADAATVKLAANRTMQASGVMRAASSPDALEAEERVEMMRRSSLREAAQQARRAAAERLEAARRAEAAALADSIARREEREIAEAQASSLRQAAQYADADGRNRQRNSTSPGDALPGRISDPYGPQVVAEGEYFERPGTPVSELESIRFKHQREYIEQQTGFELPTFRMPDASLDPPQRSNFREERGDELIGRHRGYQPDEPSGRRLAATDGNLAANPVAGAAEAGRRDLEPRRQPKPVYEERFLSIARDAHRQDEAGALQLRRERESEADAANGKRGPQGRVVVPSIPYKEFRRANGNGPHDLPPEVVSQISEPIVDESGWHEAERLIGSGHSQMRSSGSEDRGAQRGAAAERWVPPVDDGIGEPEDFKQAIYKETIFEDEALGTQFSNRPDRRRNDGTVPAAQSPELKGGQTFPEKISANGAGEARDAWGVAWRQGDLRVADKQPTWSNQPNQVRPETPKIAVPKTRSKDSLDGSGPAWLYPNAQGPRFVDSLVDSTHRRAQLAVDSLKVGSAQTQTARDASIPQRYGVVENTLQHSREQVASRWFALKGVFEKPDRGQKNEQQPAREKKRNTPFVVVYSAAGGVGKTSLVATLGRALSSVGEKVLLTDTTSQSLLPFYFGASELHAGVVRTFSPPNGSTDAPIHMVSYDFAKLERELSSSEQSMPGDLFEELITNSQNAHRVLMDLNGSGGWLIERIAHMKPTILVPLAADMNSVIGLRAIERIFAELQDGEGKTLQPVYLLNQFDASMPLHLDVREVLTQQLGGRLLPFVIRRSGGVSEALAEGMTIVDYDPDSEVTKDYMGVANWLRNASAPATVGYRNLRWSER